MTRSKTKPFVVGRKTLNSQRRLLRDEKDWNSNVTQATQFETPRSRVTCGGVACVDSFGCRTDYASPHRQALGMRLPGLFARSASRVYGLGPRHSVGHRQSIAYGDRNQCKQLRRSQTGTRRKTGRPCLQVTSGISKNILTTRGVTTHNDPFQN